MKGEPALFPVTIKTVYYLKVYELLPKGLKLILNVRCNTFGMHFKVPYNRDYQISTLQLDSSNPFVISVNS